MKDILGYRYGHAPRSPVTLRDLDALKATVGWDDADDEALARARDLLIDDAELLVDRWRAIIGSQPHLAHAFVHPDGTANDDYKAAVKKRFVRWVRDILTRPFDQAWLDYQEEIGRRHTPALKNRTDAADTPNHVPFRYLIAFLPPTLFAISDRLCEKAVDAGGRDAIARTWTKAIALTLTLWSRPYVTDELW